MMKTDLYKFQGYLFFLFPAVAFIILRMTGFNGLYGQDAFEYLRYTHALGLYLREGILPGPFPWPPVYPMLGALAGFIMPEALALHLISVIAFAFSILLMEKIFLSHFIGLPRETRVYTLLFFACSPFVFRYSVTVMSESLALCFILAGYLFHQKYLRTDRAKYFFFHLLFVFLAVNTRYSSAVVLIIPVVLAGLRFIRQISVPWLLLSIASGVVIFLPNIMLGITDPAAMQQQYQAMTWEPLNFFRRSFSNIDGVSSYTLPNILFVTESFYHPGFIFAGGVIILGILFKPTYQTLMNPDLHEWIIFSLFTAGFPLQNARYLIFGFPLVLIILYRSAMSLIPRPNGKLKSWAFPLLFAAFLFQGVLIFRAVKPFHDNCRVTRSVVEEVGRYPGRHIYEFNMAMAFPAYGVTNTSENLWSRSIDHFEPGSLLVFNYEETKDRWEGLNPMLNWQRLQRDSNLRLIRSFDKGWNIYAIGW